MLLSLVVPFYNEEEAVEFFFARVVPVVSTLDGFDYEIVCIDDGSRDSTVTKLRTIGRNVGHVKIVELTRNFGKEAALTAGLDEANGDLIVPFDADLQDPPEVIPRLIEKWREGYDVVLAKRSNRDTDTFAKRKCAAMFYRAHDALTNLHMPDNVGDFRLFTREVLESICRLPERQRFMKGLFAWVGYKTAVVEYVREPRIAGKTKFSGWKLWNFALEGFTSFSTLPLRIWTYVGMLVASSALCYAAFMVIRTLLQGNPVPGYASLASIMLFLGGIQLMGIGVIGEYIGRIYFEAKRRPVYLIRKRYETATTRAGQNRATLSSVATDGVSGMVTFESTQV
ncbi:glycosyltransferase family 2 protein [Paraburkholderia sp. DGU8]|uniref:glycosyltransferase family 2 protein n=1 Tax=Paraburkholderia sp. DGU8 TaxID=3161997 RepID=UPI00346620E6